MLACFALGAARPVPAQRIIAVGDLHGDFQAWTEIATAAGLLGPDGHWAGGATTLVQLGDITDRGPDSLKIVRSLQQLQAEAPRARGQVIVVLGNHEAMNLIGDNRYTTPGEYAAFVDDRSVARHRLSGHVGLRHHPLRRGSRAEEWWCRDHAVLAAR